MFVEDSIDLKVSVLYFSSSKIINKNGCENLDFSYLLLRTLEAHTRENLLHFTKLIKT